VGSPHNLVGNQRSNDLQFREIDVETKEEGTSNKNRGKLGRTENGSNGLGESQTPQSSHYIHNYK